VRTSYERLSDPDDVLSRVAGVAPRAVIFDVEPLVAFWDTDQASLDAGVALVLDRLRGVAGIQVVVFATNSVRRPSAVPDDEVGTQVLYFASAGKPIRTNRYRRLPPAGLVVGDQVATDGLLARRLGYAFLHYEPTGNMPRGPSAMRMLGRALRPLLFAR